MFVIINMNNDFLEERNFKFLINHVFNDIKQKKGIEIRSGFWPMSDLKGFKSIYVKDKEKISKELFEKTLVLPSNVNLKYKDIIKFKKEIEKNIPKK